MTTQTSQRKSRAGKKSGQDHQPQPPEPGTDETGHGDTLEERSTEAKPDEGTAALEARIAEVKGEQPEPGPSDPPDSSGGPSSDTRSKEDQPQPEPEPTEPVAALNIGRYPYYLHRPTVTSPDGVAHQCGHRDGHVTIKQAMTCARALGREFGLGVPDADPAWADGGPGEPVA